MVYCLSLSYSVKEIQITIRSDFLRNTPKTLQKRGTSNMKKNHTKKTLFVSNHGLLDYQKRAQLYLLRLVTDNACNSLVVRVPILKTLKDNQLVSANIIQRPR